MTTLVDVQMNHLKQYRVLQMICISDYQTSFSVTPKLGHRTCSYSNLVERVFDMYLRLSISIAWLCLIYRFYLWLIPTSAVHYMFNWTWSLSSFDGDHDPQLLSLSASTSFLLSCLNSSHHFFCLQPLKSREMSYCRQSY